MEHEIWMYSREDNLTSNLFRALQVYIALTLLSENSLLSECFYSDVCYFALILLMK